MENTVININQKISSNTKVIVVQGDIIVPDIKPDIISIINANAIPYIYKEEALSGKIRIEGNIDSYIVYLADNGENRSIGTTLSFIENIEDSKIKEGDLVKQSITLESIEAKEKKKKKIAISATLKVKSEVFEQSEISLKNNFNEINDIQKLTESLNIKSIIGLNTVKTSIKEDIIADETYNISEILKVSLNIVNTENKISINKVLAKADAEIKVIFLSEDGRIGMINASIPVMSFIDIDKISDKNICNTNYVIRNMLFKVSSTNKRAINCQIEFDVSCEAYEIKNIEVIQDMYGINTNIDFTKKDVLVQTDDDDIFEKISINENIIVEDILSIYDVEMSAKVLNITPVGASYNYECELNMCLYYEADSKTGLNIKNVTIPFNFKLNNDFGNIEFKFNKKDFKINGENVNLEIEIIAYQRSNNAKSISIIENVETSEINDDDGYKMIVYFVKPSDTLWSIGKQFRVPVQDVLLQNELENENSISAGDRLYIMR